MGNRIDVAKRFLPFPKMMIIEKYINKRIKRRNSDQVVKHIMTASTLKSARLPEYHTVRHTIKLEGYRDTIMNWIPPLPGIAPRVPMNSRD